ncbi:MAG: ABC transporter permease [Alphaproteobacteria bacterium]|nr:ABC transporter permease [Alphaproteobacteria bacterium]MBU1562601.1 ABC transporter permease [Alphaproteobacteria bacterium]MBU2303243.1 ABC transporter permease [Alphaproteobacteria bacterium]MBU2370378.1 ABC transporter permease [Alphaproteobacteria bacterium]
MEQRISSSQSPIALTKGLWRNRDLILQLVRRDVAGRYKGSVFGILWSLVNPIVLLTVYTLVFSVVFQAKWGTGDESRAQFALQLFAGMIVHGLFCETLQRAPTLIMSNVSYVKKIVFPLEVLPVVTVGTTAFHAAVSLVVLTLALLLVTGSIPLAVVFVPVVLAPLMVMSLGFAWLLSSLGVYLRDVAQPISLITTILLFASPVFYPASSLPEYIQPWLLLNPLTYIIGQLRDVMIAGSLPDFGGLAIYSVVSIAVAWMGGAWFQKTRAGFANVL